jgi:hypothetical protein
MASLFHFIRASQRARGRTATMPTTEATRHATQMAKLREIYGATGRREFALLFIRNSPIGEGEACWQNGVCVRRVSGFSGEE